MKNAFLACFMLVVMVSCKTAKKVTETDRSTSQTVTEREIKTRPGDTITIDIPNIRYKDTTIQRINYENKTIARVTYDDVGNQKFECMSAEINLLTEKINEMVQNDINKESEKKNEFNPQQIFYALGFLGLVFIIGILFIGYTITKVQKQLPQIANQIFKQKN